jgi:hypothetical protein
MTDTLVAESPEAPENPGLSYAYLVAEGTRIVQRLSGEVWTEYNESDPGVTTLEQLCYALTELSYRAGLPLADLLVGEPGGAIDPRRQALYPARDIFPVNPVTGDDYRRLLIDRVPRVANAWLTPRGRDAGPRAVGGLYDIALYVPGLDSACKPDDEGKVVDEARRVYCAHRGLCEDARSITILEAVPAVVKADVTLADAGAADTVLAALLFRLGNFLAPEPARAPLAELVRKGVPPAQIFDGPLPLHGFITGDQLQPRANEIPVQEVVRTAVATPGVTSVLRLSVTADGKTRSGEQSVPVGRGRILRLDTRPSNGAYSIRLYSNGVEVRPDPARVERELKRLWAAHRQTYPLADEYGELFGMPAGEYRDVERYYSIQNQYPDTYGISAFGLPADAGDARTGQARQLKGYLLPFEQLLADFFAQLAHARDLFSTLGPDDPAGRRSYWFQHLDASVPNVEPLLKAGPDGYHQGLPRLVEAHDPWVERRGHFLSFLLDLYADELTPNAVAGADGDPGGGAARGPRGGTLLEARLELLRRLVEATHDRGRGWDYLRRPSPANVAGMELRVRIQLGMPVADRRPLNDVLQGWGDANGRGGADGGGALEWHADEIETAFEPVSVAGQGSPSTPAVAALPGGLPAGLLDADPGPGDLRVGSLPGDAGVSAVVRAGGAWRLVGRYPDRDGAVAGARAFAGQLGQERRHSRQLYIVEHLLLREGRCRGADGRTARPAGDGRAFAYGFALTAVLILPQRLLEDKGYRDFAAEVVRANTPAHLAVKCCFLGTADGLRFESLYRAWQQALERGERGPLRAASARLREFLSPCPPSPPSPPSPPCPPPPPCGGCREA